METGKKPQEIKDQIKGRKQQQVKYRAIQKQLDNDTSSENPQRSTSDPDSRHQIVRGIDTLVAIPAIGRKSQAPDPKYNAENFIYNPDDDAYTCPREILYTAMAPGTKPATILLNNTRPGHANNARYQIIALLQKSMERSFSAVSTRKTFRTTLSALLKAVRCIKRSRRWSSIPTVQSSDTDSYR